jgi:hypothetical protein
MTILAGRWPVQLPVRLCTVTATESSFYLTGAEYLVLVDCTVGNASVFLPPAQALGSRITPLVCVKKIAGAAGNRPVVWSVDDGGVEGGSTYTIGLTNTNTAVTFASDGLRAWWIVAAGVF